MGKTYQVAQACSNIGATMICANEQEAKRVAETYGIKTMSLHKNFEGMTGPFLIDNHAVSSLLWAAETEISSLKKRVDEQERVLQDIKHLINKTDT
jgi:hypothetical protein